MKSHEYANKLRELADFLTSKPEFDAPWCEKYAYVSLYYFADKEPFLAAVRAIGSGEKKWSDADLTFTPSGTDMLRLQIGRSIVCRKVQEAKWECDPILSQDEEAEIGA